MYRTQIAPPVECPPRVKLCNLSASEIVEFAKKYRDILALCGLVATGHTGQRIREEAQLEFETLLSGPVGGDQQIGSRIACERTGTHGYIFPRSLDCTTARTRCFGLVKAL
jgi:hypothetical protein